MDGRRDEFMMEAELSDGRKLRMEIWRDEEIQGGGSWRRWVTRQFKSVISGGEFKLWLATAGVTAIVLTGYNWLVVDRIRLNEIRTEHLSEIEGRLIQWSAYRERYQSAIRCGVLREQLDRTPEAEQAGFVPKVGLGEFERDALTGIIARLVLVGTRWQSELEGIRTSILRREDDCNPKFYEAVDALLLAMRSEL